MSISKFKRSGDLVRKVVGVSSLASEFISNSGDAEAEKALSHLYNNISLLKLCAIHHGSYLLWTGRINGIQGPIIPAKPSFFTTAAAFHMLFDNMRRRRLRWLGPARRVAYISAGHALWLQKVVSSIMTREGPVKTTPKERHSPIFAGLIAHQRNKSRREGPESFPKILFANSGAKRLEFMEKAALHISRTAELKFHDLAVAARHLSAEIANTAKKQKASFFSARDKNFFLSNEKAFNDNLDYKTVNTTKIMPVRHRDGRVEMVSPSRDGGGMLSAFLDLDQLPNKRKYLLKYISTLARVLMKEVLPETLKQRGGGLVEGGAEIIDALKVFFKIRHRDFIKDSIDTINSQSGDIFFTPFAAAEPAALDHNNRPMHRLFANELN